MRGASFVGSDLTEFPQQPLTVGDKRLLRELGEMSAEERFIFYDAWGPHPLASNNENDGTARSLARLSGRSSLWPIYRHNMHTKLYCAVVAPNITPVRPKSSKWPLGQEK